MQEGSKDGQDGGPVSADAHDAPHGEAAGNETTDLTVYSSSQARRFTNITLSSYSIDWESVRTAPAHQVGTPVQLLLAIFALAVVNGFQLKHELMLLCRWPKQ